MSKDTTSVVSREAEGHLPWQQVRSGIFKESLRAERPLGGV